MGCTCPGCGEPMRYGQYGVRRDGTPATGWRCSRCWRTVWEGEKPWVDTLSREDWMKYVAEFGSGPSEWFAEPPDWVHILKRHQWPPIVQLRLAL